MSKKIRFAHLADLHLGGFRDERLTRLNLETFKEAIKKIISEKFDFCIFAGDIFNTPMPSLEIAQSAVIEFMKLKKEEIPIYVIGGSHDYSNTGKSFINLFHSSGILIDVCNFKKTSDNSIILKPVIDEKTGTRITGIVGRKKGLDKHYYEKLESITLDKSVLNIFMFHSSIDDFKPDFMKNAEQGVKKSYLPEGFNFYAGGHIHTPMIGEYSKGKISYPGPLFPNSFTELLREKPGFNICEFDTESSKLEISRFELKTYESIGISIDISGLDPILARENIIEKIGKVDVKGKIVLLEIKGVLNGRISDINILDIIAKLYDSSAFHVLKNTYRLSSALMPLPDISSMDLDSEKIEEEILDEYFNNDTETKNKISKLFQTDLSRLEDERVIDFEERVNHAFKKILREDAG